MTRCKRHPDVANSLSNLGALYPEEASAARLKNSSGGLRVLGKAGFGPDLKETDYVLLKEIGCPAAKPKPFCDIHPGRSYSR
jgi:hypothetical protein